MESSMSDADGTNLLATTAIGRNRYSMVLKRLFRQLQRQLTLSRIAPFECVKTQQETEARLATFM